MMKPSQLLKHLRVWSESSDGHMVLNSQYSLSHRAIKHITKYLLDKNNAGHLTVLGVDGVGATPGNQVLDGERLRKLLSALSNQENVKRLRIANHPIGDEGLAAITDYLRVEPRLAGLEVVNTKSSNASTHIAPLIKELCNISSLRYLEYVPQTLSASPCTNSYSGCHITLWAKAVHINYFG